MIQELNRPLLFVGHSLGGLVIKKVVLPPTVILIVSLGLRC
jgi:predicted alpha/beta hydrolase family esterase